MSTYQNATAEQLAVLDAVEVDIEKALEGARQKLAAARLLNPAEEGDFGCRRCSCDGYQRDTSSSGLSSCETPGCGHSFFSHRVS